MGLPSGLFPSGFPTKTLYTLLLSPYVLHAPPISFFSEGMGGACSTYGDALISPQN